MSEIVRTEARQVDVRPVAGSADVTLSTAAAAAIAAGVPASTRRAYDTDLIQFTDWCAAVGRTAVPATPQTVAEYITHLTTDRRPKTGLPYGPASIERKLAAIRTGHRAAGLQPPETKAARKVLSGYRQRLALAKSPQARPQKATAAVPAVLRDMLATLDRSTLRGARDAALVLLGYATAARVSELAALDFSDVKETPEGLIVTMYRRKVKTFTEAAVPYGSNPATCPVRAFRALRKAMAAEGRKSGPLFLRIDRYGRAAHPMTRHGKEIGDPTGRMTPAAAADVVARLAGDAAVEGDWSGHSLRRGFATEARRAGHDLVRIGRHGGWADGSKALLGYLEEGDRWDSNPVSGL